MNDKDIERAAINEILTEIKTVDERNKLPQNGVCFNKRLLSHNLVSTLRHPIFPRGVRKRQIISLDDDDTEEDAEEDNDSRRKRQKYSNGRSQFAKDDYIYDAREYFNPEKYREIVAYRNRKHQLRKNHREINNSCSAGGGSCCEIDACENGYHGSREKNGHFCDEQGCEGRAGDTDAETDWLSVSHSGPSVSDYIKGSSRQRKRPKSEKLQSRKHGRKSKHRHRVTSELERYEKTKKHTKHKKSKADRKKKSKHKRRKKSEKSHSSSHSRNRESSRHSPNAWTGIRFFRERSYDYCNCQNLPAKSYCGSQISEVSGFSCVRHHGRDGSVRLTKENEYAADDAKYLDETVSIASFEDQDLAL